MITPQPFDNAYPTVLPALDFVQLFKGWVPTVYQNSPKFVELLTVIALRKQYYYDVLRSLINVLNYQLAEGDYLKIAASQLGVPVSSTDTDITIRTNINNRTIFINSRGKISDFYSYYQNNNILSQFNNTDVVESGNATISINTTLTPSSVAYNKFIYDLSKLKGSGIKLIVNSTTLTYYQLGKPDSTLGTDGASEANSDISGNITGGGFYKTTNT